ncbi:MAG: cytidylate kinase-like family protein [Dysgonamonadaceae bacterium]|jgi:cytidylate kinase|nr:cytidylate kinase-like family protein [Dysgonamonadaceae bacterium]
MKKNIIITIGRQLGSGGKQIGEYLSTALEIPCYDKELILLASRESGLCKEVFEKADEKSRFSLFSGILGHNTEFIGNNYSNNYLCNETLFKIQSDIIRKLAEKESCIFVGRCADYILKDNPCLVRIFIYADRQDRISRIMKNLAVTEKEAKNIIEQTDKKRSGYYNCYSDKVWGMSTSYDLCINSSLLGIEDTAKFILDFISFTSHKKD